MMLGGPAVRAAAAMFLVGAAAIHFAVAPEHLRSYVPYGIFFLIVALAQASLAALVLVRPSSSMLLGGAAFSLLVIAIWLLSRTVGLPIGPTPGVPEPIGLPDLFASLMEWVTAILLLVADARLARERRFRPVRAALGLAPAAIFSLLFTVIGVAGAGTGSVH